MAVKTNYETVVVFSMTKGEDGIEKLIDRFKSLIEKNATLQNVDEWGKRRLAYLINDESEGYYVLMNFESDPSFITELERVYKITDGVLRSLVIKKVEKKAKKEDEKEAKAEAEKTEETETNE